MKVRKGDYWVACPAFHDELTLHRRVFCTICANTGRVQSPLAAKYVGAKHVAADWQRWLAERRNWRRMGA